MDLLKPQMIYWLCVALAVHYYNDTTEACMKSEKVGKLVKSVSLVYAPALEKRCGK